MLPKIFLILAPEVAFNVKTPDELNILQRWQTHKPYKTLTVPIGMRSAHTPLELNLHEKAHGPHGLLAGTTGSGKSEILQTYILSLAIHFHPHDLTFLLIDYKGGGMANLFENLPHLSGTITNLDGAQSTRALIAIKSELRRRQAQLGHYDINHIDTYQKLCAETPGMDPMPHLFIISDEFAELKREQPDFIKELVSAARIGRSLGVHLILATQKPSGVVDDQIWSNSNFRICLKVQNSADSKEMIRTPDAADIKLPGRGYLQVGNNEIYELFQSAYSGAEYKTAQDLAQERPDDNIYLWNDLGQSQLLTQDFSFMSLQEDIEANPQTELDITVQTIAQTFADTGLRPVPSPWLPPLGETLFLPDILAANNDVPALAKNPLTPHWLHTPDETYTGNAGQDIEIIIGIIDKVEQQCQSPLTVNFTSQGHLGIYGSAVSGRSTLLLTIALGLALKHTPSQANFYMLDFGSNSLLPLQTLPHTAEIMTMENQELLEKFQRVMIKEMKRRKDTLGQSRVSSITLHNRIHPHNTLPALFIFVDNFDPIREHDHPIETLLRDLSREGQALCMYLIFTASRPLSLRFSISANIKNNIVFHMTDKSDISNLLGRTELQSEQIPGRGLTQAETICSFQAALPTYGDHEEERVHTLQEALNSIRQAWRGPLPQPVPMIPDIVPLRDFYQNPTVAQVLAAPGKKIPIALDHETIESFCFDFDQLSHINIVGTNNIGKTNLIKVLFESLSRKAMFIDLYIVDDPLLKLNSYQSRFPACHYLTQPEEFVMLLKTQSQEVSKRKEAFAQKMKDNTGSLTPAEFAATQIPHLILVNNIANFIAAFSLAQQHELAALIEESKLAGIHFCFVSNHIDYPKVYDKLPNAIRNINAGITFLPLDQTPVLPIPSRVLRPRRLKIGEAYYVQSGIATLIKIPLITSQDQE